MLPRMHPAVFFSRASYTGRGSPVVRAAVGDEADPQPPDEIFLGGTVQFDGQQPGMGGAEPGEKRLLEGLLLVEKPEIGVVGGHDHVGARFGRVRQDVARSGRLRPP